MLLFSATLLEKNYMIQTYHHQIQSKKKEYIWDCEDSIPFNELIVSWNAARPKSGSSFKLSVSLKIDADWSDWLLYADWGANSQHSGENTDSKHHINVCQDIVQLLNENNKAVGFKIKIETLGDEALEGFKSLHACVSVPSLLNIENPNSAWSSLDIDVPLISQMQLPHPFHHRMCSATSTTSVLRYLLKSDEVDSVDFAFKAWDETFNIFGNWVLNTAHASTILGNSWRCWVQRLKGFDEIYERLKLQMPVVVSIKGPLHGSAEPYEQGHLIVVKGYDADKKRILCMDPAFSSNDKTNVSYALQDFLVSWLRRQNIAYIFEKKTLETRTLPR